MSLNFKGKILQEILEDPTREKILKELLNRRKETFIILYRDVLHLKESTARHHLKYLIKNDVIQRSKKVGTRTSILQINPLFIHEIRSLLHIVKPLAYIGMIGKENFAEEIESSVLSLTSQNYYLEKVFIFCGINNKEELVKDKKIKNLQSKLSIEIIYTELFDFEKVLKDINNLILRIIFDYQLVANITRGTKIHSIALYQLARDYGFLSFYIPEGTNKIIKLH